MQKTCATTFAVLAAIVVHAHAQIFTPGASGPAVTKAAYDAVMATGVFGGNDHKLLLVLALDRSDAGRAPGAFNPGSGGIWGITPALVSKLQNDIQTAAPGSPFLTHVQNMQNSLGIDFMTATPADMDKPVYSVAFTAVLINIEISVIPPPPLPQDTSGFGSWLGDILDKVKKALDIVEAISDLVDAIKSLWEDIKKVFGDPHVIQLVPGSDLPLCYDVLGDDNDIFKFLHETSTGIQVNAKLMSVAQETKAKYVMEVAVFSDGLAVDVTLLGITIDGQTFPWANHVTERTVGGANVKVAIHEGQVSVDFGFTTVFVNRRGNRNLFLSVKDLGQADDSRTGILGDVSSQTRVSESKTGADLVVTELDGSSSSVQLLPKGGKCWQVPGRLSVPGEPFGDLLDRNKVDCMTC